MSHQPFPKKGANLIKNTDSLKDSQVTQALPARNTVLGGRHHAHRQQEQTLQAQLLKAHCLESNADTSRHSTLALCRGTRAAGQTEQPQREQAKQVAWGGKQRQILDMETNPGQTLGAHESYTETLAAVDIKG